MTRLFLILILIFAAGSAAADENAVTITKDGLYRYISSNGIPDHEHGAFPNKGNPNTISAQEYQYRVPLQPKLRPVGSPLGRTLFGIALNGVPFDPGTAEWFKNTRSSGWNYDALSGKIDLGLDENNAHVQPSGAYHYHGIPTALAKRGERGHSALVGYAADGFPIYALYGFSSAAEPKSKVKALTSSYRLREGKRPSGPGGSFDGTFVQDFIYQEGLGDLDECNGRQGVTPDYPQGTYAYFLTKEFPFVPRCLHGAPDASFSKRDGPGAPPPGAGPICQEAAPGGSCAPGGQENMGPPKQRREGIDHVGGPGGQKGQRRAPPPEARDACANKAVGDYCTFHMLHGTGSGVCRDVGELACVPNDFPPPQGDQRGPK